MPEVFVYHPDYSPVQAFANTRDITVPSGTTIVQGIYYSWNSEGFTGQGWLQSISGGPTNMYPGFNSDEDVAQYVADQGNLDDVFSHWSKIYNINGWDAFYNAVGKNSGCMDVVRPT